MSSFFSHHYGCVWLSIMAWCWLVLGAYTAQAHTYKTPLSDIQWEVKGSAFNCTLSHNIPYYGDAVFYRRAGEKLHFYLDPKTARLETGKTLLQAKSPEWKRLNYTVDLGSYPVKRGERPVTLNAHRTERVLAELQQGMDVYFTRWPWYGGLDSAKVWLSTVHFRKAYRDYQDCLVGLLPVNYDQIKRTAMEFRAGQDGLTADEKRTLSNIAIYIKADPSVEYFFVDGHTDSRGDRKDNLELSRKRAEEVTQYLVAEGVPAEKITTRWHGERYPVASNQSAKGRKKNRRVTVRLERDLPQSVSAAAPSEAGNGALELEPKVAI